MTDPDAIALCATGTFTPTAAGFQVCSGSAGDGAKGALVPNAEPPNALDYLRFYNNLATSPSNACIEQGLPGSPGAAAPPPFITGTGCCSRATAWAGALTGTPAAGAANVARCTRLTPFTTASAVGAFDDGGMRDGVPDALLGLTKVWGASAGSWMHGGVHADNVGMWHKDLTGSPFVVNYKGRTWTQDNMLWVRMTGDNYQPSKDPWSAVFPAPSGSYISAFHDNAPSAGCGFCNTAPATNQVVTSLQQGTSKPVCATPFTETCNQYTLTKAIMDVPGGATAAAPQDSTWKATPAAQQAVKDFVVPAAKNAEGAVGSTVPSDDLTALYRRKDVPATFANTTNPNTGTPNGYDNPQGRVGGCFVTRDMYGPGKFSVLLAAPPTAPDPTVTTSPGLTNPGSGPPYPLIDPVTGEYPSAAPGAVPGGRGYVLSMWTFSYSEVYGTDPTSPKADSANTAFPYNATYTGPGAPLGPIVVEGAAASTGAATNVTVTQPSLAGMFNVDSEATIHNHEIDIEIPANTDYYGGAAMASNLGMNTANFNTWLSDTDTYGQGPSGNPTFYQQVQAVAPLGQAFISVGAGETSDTFHELSIVWHVDPAEATTGPQPQKSYVAFYRDGVEVFKCYRFVPRRSGRVIIGLWPAWWGSNYEPLTYNHVYVKVARIEFVPQADISNAALPGLVTSAAQSYDQAFPVPGVGSALGVACGFSTPIAQRQPCSIDGACVTPSSAPSSASSASSAPSAPSPPAPSSSSALSAGAWAGIAIAIVVVILIVVLCAVLLTKKRAVAS
jgi:hypothetical protein